MYLVTLFQDNGVLRTLIYAGKNAPLMLGNEVHRTVSSFCLVSTWTFPENGSVPVLTVCCKRSHKAQVERKLPPLFYQHENWLLCAASDENG